MSEIVNAWEALPMQPVPFTLYRAVHRLRYLWKLLSVTGKYMTPKTVRAIILEMGAALHKATAEAAKSYQTMPHAAYTYAKMDGWDWQYMDDCYVMEYNTVSFICGGITVTLKWMEGEASLSFSTESKGYNLVMEWTDAGAVFCDYAAVDATMS